MTRSYSNFSQKIVLAIWKYIVVKYIFWVYIPTPNKNYCHRNYEREKYFSLKNDFKIVLKSWKNSIVHSKFATENRKKKFPSIISLKLLLLNLFQRFWTNLYQKSDPKCGYWKFLCPKANFCIYANPYFFLIRSKKREKNWPSFIILLTIDGDAFAREHDRW